MFSKTILVGIVVLIIAYLIKNKYSSSTVKKDGVTVNTKSGSVRGLISVSRAGREFHEWLGIPYAKPPVGPLRFATPQPIEKWDGVRDAKAYGDACAQFDMITTSITGKEDCLTLNIHASAEPGQSPKKLLPVMFFIHGGYFVSGSSKMYSPAYFMDEDVILVTSNYRLAALGFLNSGDTESRGNMGLKDQSLALKWINENIIHFGGDPKQITIFGESAGSASVHYQMLSPMSRGLMQRAISESGTSLNNWAIYEDPVGQGKTFARKLNCPVETSTAMITCLKNVKIEDFLEIHRETMELTKSKDMLFVPTVEAVLDSETFLPDFPTNLVNSGKFEKIPWLNGFNADEGLVFGSNVLSKTDYRKRLETDWNYMVDVGLFISESDKKFVNKIREFYFGVTAETDLDLLKQFKAMTEMITDRWFSYGHYKAALAHSQHASTQVYYYNKTGPSIFDLLILIQGNYPVTVEILFGLAKNWFKSTILGQIPKSYGVCHGDELGMLFEVGDLFSVPKEDPNYEFSKDLVKTWVSFASTSNVDDVTFRGQKFPRVHPKEQLKVIEINDKPSLMNFPILERMKFWEAFENKHR